MLTVRMSPQCYCANASQILLPKTPHIIGYKIKCTLFYRFMIAIMFCKIIQNKEIVAQPSFQTAAVKNLNRKHPPY